MNKREAMEILSLLEVAETDEPVLLHLPTKSERDAARITLQRVIDRISDSRFPLYRYMFGIKAMSANRDGLDGLKVWRKSFEENRISVMHEGKLVYITDVHFKGMVDKMVDYEFEQACKQGIPVLEEDAPPQIREFFGEELRKVASGEKDAINYDEIQEYMTTRPLNQEEKDKLKELITERVWKTRTRYPFVADDLHMRKQFVDDLGYDEEGKYKEEDKLRRRTGK